LAVLGCTSGRILVERALIYGLVEVDDGTDLHGETG
jgi:hypothetical protein